MSEWWNAARVIHVVAAVFMAAPLYMLILVNERARHGRAIEANMDGYMEGIVSSQPLRCYVYLAALAVTGFGFFLLAGRGLEPIIGNWMVATKVVLTLVLAGLLTYVHTGIQPQIVALLARGGEDAAIWALRKRRKRLTATCLFLVITIVLLGIRLVVPYSPTLLAASVALGALFAWRAFGAPVPWGFA